MTNRSRSVYARKRSPWRSIGIVMRSVWARGTGKFSLIVLAIWLVVSLVSLFWTPHSLWATDGYHVWSSPSRAHWLGTDGTGADIASWLMAGAGVDLIIPVLTVVVALAIGLLLTACMVARSTVLSRGSVVLIDALISIPTILVALMLAVPFGASVGVIVAACGLSYGLNMARVCRPQALRVANSSFVESARHSGVGAWCVFMRHVVPNIRSVMMVQLSLSAGTAVLAEAGLTYLGVGVPSGVPSWGHSLATSAKFITVYPLTVVWIGGCVTIAVIALNLLGDALRDASDPLTNPALRQVDYGA